MRSNYEVADVVWNLLNVDSVTTNITGSIYRFSKPINDNKQNIVINVLDNPADYIQDITVNVLLYCQELSTGTPDIVTLKNMREVVVSALKEEPSVEPFCDIEVTNDRGPFAEGDHTYYHNIVLSINYRS